MSTKAKLDKLLKTKEDIKKAIKNKGGNVGDVFDEYPVAIRSLDSGNIDVASNKLSFGYSKFTELPKRFDFSGVEDASGMFYKSNLKDTKINFAPTTMTETFVGCVNLRNVDFDWTNVNDLYYTFHNSNLEKISIGKCAPERCSYMLNGTKVDTLDISNMDTSNITSAGYMMGNVHTLKGDFTITNSNVGILQTKILRNIEGNITFNYTYTSLNLSDAWLLSDESVAKILNGLPTTTSAKTITFQQNVVNNCSNETLEIAINKGWTVAPSKTITEPVIVNSSTVIPNNTYQITPRTYDFSQFTGDFESLLKNSVNCYYFEGELSPESCLEAFINMLYSGSTPRHLKVKVNSSVHNLRRAFYNTSGWPLYIIFTEDSDFSNVTDFSHMLFCDEDDVLEYRPTIDVSNWDVSNAEEMFQFNSYGYWNIVGFENWNITNKCKSLPALYADNVSIDLNHWDVSGVTSADYLFAGWKNLKYFNIDQWDVSNLKRIGYLFYKCTSIEEIDLSNWELNLNYNYQDYIFYSCSNLKRVKLPRITNNVWYTLSYMFCDCSSLESVDLSPIDLSRVNNISNMFKGCTSLKEVTITSNLSSNIYVGGMFDGVTTEGTFYYNPQYDYSKIIAELPATWTAVPLTE